MALSTQQILSLWVQRERTAGPRRARDRETLEFFEGRVAVPLPEIEASERSAVANIFAQGITAKAQRVASTVPQPWFPVAKLGQRKSERRAREKRRALLGLWDENRLIIQRQQRARWLIAYAASPILVRPVWDTAKRRWTVRWQTRSPLATYPAPMPSHLDMEPEDVIFATSKSAAEMERAWPNQAAAIRAMRGYNPDAPVDHTLTLVEYAGPDDIVLLATGVQQPNNAVDRFSSYNGANVTYDGTATAGGRWAVELERVPNRVGRCTAIVPNGISLEAPMGQGEGMKGLYLMQARLMALEYRAVANAVDPQQWFVESDTGGEIITVADGPGGVLGHVRGGNIEVIQVNPGQMTPQMIDRLENAQRVEGGVPADLGGISGSNIRTGTRGSAIMSAVLDFPIQEAQLLLGESQRLEDNLAMDIALEYFPTLTRSWGGFEFTPNAVFERDDFHEVRYSLPGTDANGLVIRMGQLQGTGLISKHTAREMIPDIRDAIFEDDQVTAEQIDAGILAEFAQPTQPGQPGGFSIVDKATVKKLVSEDRMSLADAILKVQADAQARQSPNVNPVEPGSPEAMPGIGGPSNQAGTTGPPADLQGMTDLLQSLRRGQRASPQEQVQNQAVAGVA